MASRPYLAPDHESHVRAANLELQKARSVLTPICVPTVAVSTEEELARRYHIPIPPQRDLPISWNIAPTQDVLAIRFNPETKQRSLDALQWGLIPYWAKGGEDTKRNLKHVGYLFSLVKARRKLLTWVTDRCLNDMRCFRGGLTLSVL
jgi:hypothetical protein